MANTYDFSSDNVNAFLMVLDSSGSMASSKNDVKKGLECYKEEFETFYEADSIAVAVSSFDSEYYKGEFKKVRELSTSYHTGGSTALYYSIKKGSDQIMSYLKEVTQKMGIIPRGTFIFFSDGEPGDDPGTKREALNAVSKMNNAGITTVFVAFGSAISSEFGKALGFQSTVEVSDRDSLVNFMGKELSKSCKEQSRSMKALGANFFSQAANQENSAGYSKTTSQVLEDDNWIDEI